MRHVTIGLICGAILAIWGCSHEILVDSSSEGEGRVKISLTAETETTIITKADSENPNVEDFTIEIFKADGSKRLYRDTYSNSLNQDIHLNTGDYKLLAYHGDSLGVGFDAAYFAAEENFTVAQGDELEIEAVAKISNVKVAVNYEENVGIAYEQFYAVVQARGKSKYQLKFAQDETEAGFLPTGSLKLTFYAYAEGAWRTYSFNAGTFEGNDFVTFNLDTELGSGNVVITVQIDKATENFTDSYEVSYTALDKDEPKVEVSGWSSSRSISIVEAVEHGLESLRADIVAYGEIEHCYLIINSSYLSSLGLESSIDLCEVSDEQTALLNANGIYWLKSIHGATMSYVDFIALADKLFSEPYDSSNPFKAQISLTVEDALGQSSSTDTYTISNAAPVFSYSLNSYDVWANKITDQSITVSKGNSSVISLEYQEDGEQDWIALEAESVGSTLVSFGTISELEPGTTYNFRAMYNGNESTAKSYSVTTEEELQVDNPSFETWQELSKSFTQSSSTKTRTYYYPYSSSDSDPWWAVNSQKSMLNTSLTVLYEYYKIFPCAGYSTDASVGDKSAHIFVCNVGNTNSQWATTGTTYVGELWIGTASSTGTHSTDGHAFASRPAKLQYDYKYASSSSETYGLEVALYAEDGTEIASYSSTSLTADSSSSWYTNTVALDYGVTTLKAATIYICFTSSTASSPSISIGASMEVAGTSYEIHGGSSLRIDNIKLIYE